MRLSPETGQVPLSGLSAEAILEQIVSHYALPPPRRCRLHAVGMHDNYLVESANEKYIARVYRRDSRSADAIQYELALLDHLHRHGCPVAHPVLTTAAEPSITLRTTDGERIAVLFTHAPGSAPGRAIEPRHSEALGQVIARIHLAADSFSTPHARQILDVDYLLDASIEAIRPYLTHTQQGVVQKTQRRIRNTLPVIPRQAPWFGPCTGDVNPRNFHVDDTGHITVFDFDQCGLGWRAFEVGKFFAALPSGPTTGGIRVAFLRGYESVRALEPHEQRAIPPFSAMACLWVMALHVDNADLVGRLLADPDFWNRKLETLRELESAQ
jgi:Ser/Thr protein kinase RdoA (MazF antagonist)